MTFASRNSRVGFAVSIPPSGTSRREAGGGASSRRRRSPSARLEVPWVVRSCKTVSRRSWLFGWALCGVSWLDGFGYTPTRDHTGPPSATTVAALPFGGASLGSHACLTPPPPEGSAGQGQSTFTEQDLHPRRLPGRFLLHCLRPPVVEKRAGRPRSGIRSPAH